MQSFLQRKDGSDTFNLVPFILAIANVLASLSSVIDFFSFGVHITPQRCKLSFALGKEILKECFRCRINDDGIVIMPHRARFEAEIRRILPVCCIVSRKHHGVQKWIVAWNFGGKMVEILGALCQSGSFNLSGQSPYRIQLCNPRLREVLQTLLRMQHQYPERKSQAALRQTYIK